MKSPQKRQGPTPERGHPKKRHRIDLSASDQGEDDADSSGGSTIILHQTSGTSSDDGHSSRKWKHVILTIIMGMKTRQYYDSS